MSVGLPSFAAQGVLSVAAGKNPGSFYVDLMVLGGKIQLRGGGFNLSHHGRTVEVEGQVDPSGKFGIQFKVQAFKEI